ncbi:SDR family NAD(P)-dependent oxidoreductase [Desulfospira joergensenii]|uniref:SDR family NAD(P)-dependent oxidoreductase n=1 Tax=Desulfospira joergensenii TaxID=53329 RepID=UPI0003B4F20D|nr:3-oxoacyl-ACP reductase family protein [Desulfospira joergensenii]
MGVKERVALITGASRGIGRGLAVGFARAGAQVVVNYRKSREEADKTVNQIIDQGGRAMAIQADVSERKDVVRMKNEIMHNLGRLDILVNNAGMNRQNFFWDITDEEWDLLMKVNLKSVFICAQEFMPVMAENNWGRIINIASVSGQYGGPKTLHYATSKAGIISLTQGLSRYGAKDNILVNAIAPGIIKTDMTKKELEGPMGKTLVEGTLVKKPGEINDVLQACLHLASDEQNYITGHTLNVNGGIYLG